MTPPDQRTDLHSDGWAQINVEFTDWHHAESAATRHLRPLLESDAGIEGWWFVRKHPCWRVRCRPVDSDASRRLAAALNDLTISSSLIRSWCPITYEPETRAFGGPTAMDIAHELFHHDSRAITDILHQPPTTLPRRRELTVLAISDLLRAAGLDWFEQGDVWAKVADLRQIDHPQRQVTAQTLASLRRLMTIDASLLTTNGCLTSLAGWLDAFDLAGRRIAELCGHGSLQRGLRAVLAHHVIFHWNRIGLSHTDQLTLSSLARDVVLASASAAS